MGGLGLGLAGFPRAVVVTVRGLFPLVQFCTVCLCVCVWVLPETPLAWRVPWEILCVPPPGKAFSLVTLPAEGLEGTQTTIHLLGRTQASSTGPSSPCQPPVFQVPTLQPS